MNRLIIVGSPRANGRCAHLGEMLFEACIDECPEDELYLAPVSELDIAGCVACDACKKAAQAAARARLAEKSGTEGAQADDAQADGGEVEMPPIPYCPRFDDDMLDLYEVLCSADELIVVAPVFFSGAPAGLTALLDRLQPFFWEWLELRGSGDEGRALASEKRPATLHVVGEGLDKNGYSALVGKVRSAIAPAGFVLERVLDWVGRITPDGTIEQEAAEYRLPPLGVPLFAQDDYLLPATAAGDGTGSRADAGRSGGNEPAAHPDASAAKRAARPKLDLGSKGAQAGAKGSAAGGKAGGKGSRAAKGGHRQGAGGKGGDRRESAPKGGNRNAAGGRNAGGGNRNAKGGKRHG